MKRYNTRSAAKRTGTCLAWWFALSCSVTSAHEGPPFPLLMDQSVGDYTVSLWADPDIGEARFFVILEDDQGNMPGQIPEVSLWTEPLSGRLPRANYDVERQPLRNRIQFEGKPWFDRQDWWQVGVRISSPDGVANEITTKVESTPPGFGAWDLVIYLFPFLLLGGAWLLAMRRRRRAAWHVPASENLSGSASGPEPIAARPTERSAPQKS